MRGDCGPGACIDLMPAFWRAYDASAAHSRRAEALLALFFTPHRALYEGAGLAPEPALAQQWLRRFDTMAPLARRRSATLPALFQVQLDGFQARFPDFDAAATAVYFLPSLFQFDAHLEPWDGALPLFIGIDGILYHHGADADPAVLFSHETFHLYQGQRNPDQMLDPAPPLHALLWSEGTATYASGLLNPQASRRGILFDHGGLLDPGPAPDSAPELMAAVAAELLHRCDSTLDEDTARYFSVGYRGNIPPRTGYLIGLAIADSVSAGMTPAQMAALPPTDARTLVLRHLQLLSGRQHP